MSNTFTMQDWLADRSVDARLRGDHLSFGVGLRRYEAQVDGNQMRGTVAFDGRTTEWAATRR